MNYLLSLIDGVIKEQVLKLKHAQQELIGAPMGTMRIKCRKHYTSYYQVINRKEINITGNTETIRSLLKKSINLRVERSAEKNINLLQKFVKQYQPNDYSDILRTLPQSYKAANTAVYKNGGAEQNKFVYNPRTHIHETAAGIFVRSKSEVIIANTLTNYGIPFFYEYRFPVLTKEGKKIYPDFKIVCADGLVIIWEHWGLLDQIDYCISQAYKLNAYNNQGYVLGQNLIITSDDNHGGCNAQQIDQIVRTLILPHMGIK